MFSGTVRRARQNMRTARRTAQRTSRDFTGNRLGTHRLATEI
jgi:hypothetical protein